MKINFEHDENEKAKQFKGSQKNLIKEQIPDDAYKAKNEDKTFTKNGTCCFCSVLNFDLKFNF